MLAQGTAVAVPVARDWTTRMRGLSITAQRTPATTTRARKTVSTARPPAGLCHMSLVRIQFRVQADQKLIGGRASTRCEDRVCSLYREAATRPWDLSDPPFDSERP
jgi:hypothetical protein